MENVLKALAESYKDLPKRREFIAALNALATITAKALAGVDRRADAKLASLKNGKDGHTPTDRELRTLIKPLIPAPMKGDPGESIKGEPGIDGKDGSPDFAEDIRNKLELLDGEERLKIEAIKDLREELDELKKERGSQHHTFAIQRGQLMTYDLSDQLDGATKTFVLPAFWRIISVQSTSTPVVFRPTVDYTDNAATPSLTFTDEIDAATTLAAGQTVLVIYASP